jgi:hypothetical protein
MTYCRELISDDKRKKEKMFNISKKEHKKVSKTISSK